MGEETVFAQFREIKHGIFQWGFARTTCYSFRKVSSKPRKSINWVNFLYSRNTIIPFSSHYYIFDSHSRDNICQASQNTSSVLPKFLTIEHVLNFITTT